MLPLRPDEPAKPKPSAPLTGGAPGVAKAPSAAPPALGDRLQLQSPSEAPAAPQAKAHAPAGGLRFALSTLWQTVKGWFTAEPAPPKFAPRDLPMGPTAFRTGANLPWIDCGWDFGACAWSPEGGLSAKPAARAKLEATFEKLAKEGVQDVRWFMLGDGRAGIRFAEDGTPLGLDHAVLKDLDVALAAARKHGLKLTFSLVDFGFGHEAKVEGGVQVGGHLEVFRDPVKRKALIEKVFVPIAKHVGDDPAVAAWEVINEPEWITFGAGSADPRKSVAPDEMKAFIREATAALHAAAPKPVTVGSASTRWLPMVEGLGLDFYQAHWYDHLELVAPLSKPTSALKLDRPVILGEYPTKASKKGADEILETAHQAGFGGAWGWGIHSTEGASDPEVAIQAPGRFRREHPQAVADLPPGGRPGRP